MHISSPKFGAKYLRAKKNSVFSHDLRAATLPAQTKNRNLTYKFHFYLFGARAPFSALNTHKKSCTGRRQVQDYRVTDYNNNNDSSYVSSDEDTDDEDGDDRSFVDCRRWGLASPVSTSGSTASMASSSSSSAFGSTPRDWLTYFGSKLHLPPMKKSLFLM